MKKKWLFDIEITCPLCGGHKMKYSDMNCPKRHEILNEKYFIMLKFMELEYRIKELEKLMNDEKDETMERDGSKEEKEKENNTSSINVF